LRREKRKNSQPLFRHLFEKKKNRIIALSVPQGAQAPSPAEAASHPCEATPLRLALEPRTAENKEGPVYAAVALAGGGVARLEVTLSPSDGGPTAAAAAPSLLLLRPGQRESKSVEAAERKAHEEKKLPSLPSPSEMRGAFGGGGGGGDSSKRREQQLQEDKEGAGGDGGGGGNGNGSRHSPVGAAGRAVAGLTAAAVGALPRALLRTFSGGNVSASASAATAEVKCLAFSRDAALLACGGEDGVVRLLSWPSLTAVSEVRPAAASASAPSGSSSGRHGASDGVRDLDFGPASTDGGAHLLAVVLESGAASVWRVGAGVSSAAPLATLPPPPMPLEAARAAARAAAKRSQGGGRAPPPPPRPATVARLRFDRAPPPAAVRLLAAVNHPACGGFLAAASARATSTPADPGAPPLALSWAPLPALSADAAAAAASGGGAPPPPPPPQRAKRLPAPPPTRLLPSPVTAFDVSACGRLVGAGSSDGDTAVARADDLSVVAASKGKHMVFVTAVSFAPASPPSPSSPAAAAAAAPPPALLSVSADASAALTRAPASALARRAASASCGGCCAVSRTLARVLTALLALLVLLLFLAEAAARRSGAAACRAPAAAAPSPNPLSALLRSLGPSPSAPPPRHRLLSAAAREHLERSVTRITVLASAGCRAAVAERLRAAGPGALFPGGGGDGEL